MSISLVGYSLPVFFVGLLLLIFVIVRWNVLPYPDYSPPTKDPVAFFQTMLLPWVTLAILYAAYYARLTRSQMLETMGEDYIRSARAKGLPEKVVVRKHAFRAGLTPIVTSARLSIHAVTEYDLPTITATVLVAAVFVIVMNLVVDLLYAAIDPRVRLS
jgi:peptide/nickel transport system permease protein